MRQVIIVSLGNNAYNVDDEGCRVLRRYLDRARARLKTNPDAEEILADLERGIGEKCAASLNPNKNVVSAEDIARILREIGPVDDDPASADVPPADAPPHDAPHERVSPKIFRRKRKGRALAGVCTGLSEYFAVDVVLVRLAFVGLTLFTGGAGLILYIIVALVVPADESFGPLLEYRKDRFWIAVPIGIALLVVIYVGGFAMHGPRFFSPGMGPFEMLFAIFIPFAFFGVLALVVVSVAVMLIRYVAR